MTGGTEPMEPRSILAAVYSDGLEADLLLADLGYGLRAAGYTVAGLVQRNTFTRNRAKCDMEIEELSSGKVLQLSEDRGGAATGCRLDRSALAEAAGLLAIAFGQRLDILILNKFGRAEAEGGGLRDVIAAAAQLSVPTIVGVPSRNLEPWRTFVDELAEECAIGSNPVRRWLSRQGINLDKAASAQSVRAGLCKSAVAV